MARKATAGRFEVAAGGFASSRCKCSGRADGHLQKKSLPKHNRREAYDNDQLR